MTDTIDVPHVDVPLQPMDQLLAMLATLSAHGIRVEHTMYAFRVPLELFAELPGGDSHEWGSGSDAFSSKKLDFGNGVSLILMTSTPKAAV